MRHYPELFVSSSTAPFAQDSQQHNCVPTNEFPNREYLTLSTLGKIIQQTTCQIIFSEREEKGTGMKVKKQKK